MMHAKLELIELIYNAYHGDLMSAVEGGPARVDLERMSEGQLWAIAIDMDLMGAENE